MLALFGLDVGDLVADAIRSLVDLLVPDFASGWATSLVTSLVAVPDVTGPGFAGVDGMRTDLVGVGFGLLALCLIAGGLQLALAGVASGGVHAGEMLRRAVIAAGALAVFPSLLQASTVGVNVLTAQLVQAESVQHGLDSAFGAAFAFGAFTQGLSLGLAIPAAIAIAFFTVALLVMKTGLTALLAVLAVGGPLALGLSPLPHAQWLVRAWVSGLVAVLVVPIAWALVFSVSALLAGDALALTGTGGPAGGGPFANLAKPLAAVACFWVAYRTPGFLLAAARSVGLQPSHVLGGGTATLPPGAPHRRAPAAVEARQPPRRASGSRPSWPQARRRWHAGRPPREARQPARRRAQVLLGYALSATEGERSGPRQPSRPPSQPGAPHLGVAPAASTRARRPKRPRPHRPPQPGPDGTRRPRSPSSPLG